MKLTLKFKIISLVMAAALIPSLVMLLLMMRLEARIAAKAEDELNILAKLNIGQIARDVQGLCLTVNDIIQGNINYDLKVAHDVLAKYGTVTLGQELVEWEALDQITHQTQKVSLPKFMVGGVWLDQNRDFGKQTPVVDEVTRLVGTTCTIFQRMNERGDMLRVATTVPDSDGKRAIVTYIPVVNSEGVANPIVAAVLKGESYRGLAYVVNAPYLTAYEPISDSAGKVIGMLYVGEKVEGVESLRRAIVSIKVGKTGYVAVLEGKGNHQGRYIISKDSKRDGESIWEERDADGNLIIQSMIHNALQAPPNACVYEHYFWTNPDQGEKAPRAKVSANIYFAPWDWVILATSYEDDFYAAKQQIRASFNQLTMEVIGAGLLVLLLAIGMAFLMGNRIARPLGLIIGVVTKIADGDVQGAREILAADVRQRRGATPSKRADEIVQLVGALGTMTSSLDALIGQVQHSGVQVTTSAMQISASAREIEGTVAEQAASTREVNATSKEIASTSETLVQTMDEVGETVVQTAATAETGRTNLNRMESAMHQLIKATSSISSQLGVINDKANKISSVVTTINKISDQTNLLSLNAAIEAEKAGEYGKGFSVVARETNRLADQTVIATQDIERMVREMQSSVSSGVMEMDKFAEEVRQGVKEVATISEHLGQVIDQVKALESRFDSVKDGMRNQSQGAQQISEAVDQLSTAADQTRQSLHEFNQATEQLTKVVQGLKQEVSRFKISAKT